MKAKHVILIILILGIVALCIGLLVYSRFKNTNTYSNYTNNNDDLPNGTGGVPAEKAVGINIFINDDSARSNIPKDMYLLLQESINKKDAGTYVFLNYSQADKTVQYRDKNNHIWNAKYSDNAGFDFQRVYD